MQELIETINLQSVEKVPQIYKKLATVLCDSLFAHTHLLVSKNSEYYKKTFENICINSLSFYKYMHSIFVTLINYSILDPYIYPEKSNEEIINNRIKYLSNSRLPIAIIFNDTKKVLHTKRQINFLLYLKSFKKDIYDLEQRYSANLSIKSWEMYRSLAFKSKLQISFWNNELNMLEKQLKNSQDNLEIAYLLVDIYLAKHIIYNYSQNYVAYKSSMSVTKLSRDEKIHETGDPRIIEISLNMYYKMRKINSSTLEQLYNQMELVSKKIECETDESIRLEYVNHLFELLDFDVELTKDSKKINTEIILLEQFLNNNN